MPQRLIQSQNQKQVQQQRLTQQQVLQVKLLEMPLTELEQHVQAEIDDNPALEITPPEDTPEYETTENDYEEEEESVSEEQYEREERQSALEDALQNIGSDDQMPVAMGYHSQNTADREEIIYGNPVSFYDRLKEQMGEEDLTDEQEEVMEYLIGSLDSDGLLRKPLHLLCDELAIYHHIDIDEKELEHILMILQRFDPAGIGARSLQECLEIQIKRKEPSPVTEATLRVITECFDDFKLMHWQKIMTQLDISEEMLTRVRHEIQKLNPKPGSAMGETESSSIQQITPDFIVDTADDGTVTFTISRGRVPELYVSPVFSDMLKQYQNNREGMSRQTREAFVYAREKVERAQGYIEAIRLRRHTLYVTMKAIIDLQRKYFQEGDENDLRPMVLKDVADRTGLDISTISRVSNAKYAQTRWGTFRLRHFFSDGIKTESGEELSVRKLRAVLQEVVNAEDKQHPLNDDKLAEVMNKRGFPIARRTVSKYREQLGIPVARLRKQ